MTDQEPRRRDIVTIGASAGGIQPLGVLLSKLPADLPACIAVVIHRPRSYEGRLVSVLGRRTVLDVVEPADGDPVRPGRVYLAPPDLHLTFADPEHFRLSREPVQHRHRPAVDSLFRSAAEVFGARTVGVLLSGSGSDGVRGLRAIKHRGGASIVQDPDEARFPGMPTRAIELNHVDAALRVEQIAGALLRLVEGDPIEP